MERIDEAGDTQESSRRSTWPVRRSRAQRGQAAGQSGKWPQGWLGQKSGEDYRGTAERPASSAGTAEEVVNTVMALIRALRRVGHWSRRSRYPVSLPSLTTAGWEGRPLRRGRG